MTREPNLAVMAQRKFPSSFERSLGKWERNSYVRQGRTSPPYGCEQSSAHRAEPERRRTLDVEAMRGMSRTSGGAPTPRGERARAPIERSESSAGAGPRIGIGSPFGSEPEFKRPESQSCPAGPELTNIILARRRRRRRRPPPSLRPRSVLCEV
ncbi:hypothetical protein MPTK1_3g15390 [Marchantia polymorpha subsp. ruderalis]|uniref:Uncharacterized protein n=2 Tax=Marchantia polymorpha TaxID=3197 RepID=A0AAF6B127_MARPO|nr:hypothetical protein MARPO_0004s0133 [Marchantia polymorpha]BBN05711.1 hypothetical protein Mp_3g15390 [Marchantia polymorpha subsp. ruderalis]|eukprot:PTQ48870.1 hypothetical protein MARPO_0004s0133 [Marchantia polymorpha]